MTSINTRKKRSPKLRFSEYRSAGWCVFYKHPVTGQSTKKVLGIRERERQQEATVQYHEWCSRWLSGEFEAQERARLKRTRKSSDDERAVPKASFSVGSIAAVTADYIVKKIEGRARLAGEKPGKRKRDTLHPRTASDQKRHLKDFIVYLNEKYGPKACNRLLVSEIGLADVEEHNRSLVAQGYSHSQVQKRLQIIRRMIHWASRPEHGSQMMRWTWEGLDRMAGEPTKEKMLPTKAQLLNLLDRTDLQGGLMIWMGIGLGFGPSDLAAVRVGQIDERGYDLRRGKTGLERFGETPPLVWAYLSAYLAATKKLPGDLLFLKETGQPLDHSNGSDFFLFWRQLRSAIGETKETLNGFYVLRHLGASEFGSRPGASLGGIKRWLGHGASSKVCDHYLKPIAPEYREVVEFVRERLETADIPASRTRELRPVSPGNRVCQVFTDDATGSEGVRRTA